MDELASEQDGERLSRALGHAVGELTPDLGRLVAEAATQGRSLRRRRQVQAAASVAAVAALAIGAAQLVTPGGHGDGQTLVAAAGGQVSPRPSDAQNGPSGPVGPNGTWAITGQGVLLAARDALPQGTVFVRAQGSTSMATLPGSAFPAVGAGGTGWLAEDHGQGAQTLNVGITADAAQVLAGDGAAKGVPTKLADTLACPSPLPGNLTSCTIGTTPDGGRTKVEEGFQATSGTSRSVSLLRPDGTLVVATAQHTPPGSATGAAARAGLPMPDLTVAELTAVVQSAELQPWVTAQFSARASSAVQPYEDLNSAKGSPTARPSGPPSTSAG